MTTPLVLLGLAILAGAVVWVLSVRHSPQRGSSSWEPRAREPSRTAPPARADAPAMTSSGAGTTSPSFDLADEEDLEPGFSARSRAADSFAYVPLGVSDGLSAKTRLIGIAGLIALIVLTSAAVALALWLLGHALGLQLSHFANG
ncbi:MAG: hypothetical protein ACJ758_06115 [Actinomycetota bacterium]